MGFDVVLAELKRDPGLQFTRQEWDQWTGMDAGMQNKIFMSDGKLRVRSWDGLEYAFSPNDKDLFADDWKVLK